MRDLTASEVLLEIAQRLAQPHQRSFYSLLNAIDAFQRVGVAAGVLEVLLREAEARAAIEGIPSWQREEVLLIAKSRLEVGQSERLTWLRQLEEEVSFARRGREWKAPTRDRRRISRWVSIVALNRALAPGAVCEWASSWAGQARLMKSLLYHCSFDVVSKIRFGHEERARRLAARILAYRDRAGYWGNADKTLTLRIAVNLFDAGLTNESELSSTLQWVLRSVRFPFSRDEEVRNLALLAELLTTIGRTGCLDVALFERTLRAAAPHQCGMRGGDCRYAPSQVRADTAFYVTSFDSKFEFVRAVVGEVCRSHGIEVVTTESEGLAHIDDLSCRWCAGITQAMFVIADMTALERPNVAFELGFAKGQGKRVIILFNPEWARERGHAQFMSDLPHLVRLQYRAVSDLRRELGAAMSRIKA